MYILYNGLFLVVEYNLEFLQYLHQLTSSGWLSVREGEVMDGETGTSHLMKKPLDAVFTELTLTAQTNHILYPLRQQTL